ncbi:MAG TPA: alpha/beta fold hydrolase, partial [Candidatus Nanoarchaeia archaeon]|nr:alpha/beta fold hydrolase [Candidatus Nanoarchaeia archaeon]
RILFLSDELLTKESGISVFFKRIFNFLFGAKQDVALLTEEQSEKYIVLTQEFNDFFTNHCSSQGLLSDVKVSDLNIAISEQKSNIKTQASEPQKSCFDDKGQRTTNCCDGDEYRNKEELYPVIFVHGHASEGITGGRGDVQSSLDTFAHMSNYFSNNGFTEKSLLYPESAEKLAKGSWAYCNKPVVVRVTYYTGILSGTTHNYAEGIEDYAPILADEVDAVLYATNKDKAIIVAHSMGGIISRYYIKYNGGSSKVEKMITVASPHYGVTQGWSSLLNIDLLSLSAKESKQMVQESDFLRTLNQPSDSLVESYSIVGNQDITCSGDTCDDSVLYVSDGILKSGRASKIFVGSQYEHNGIVNQQDVANQILNWIRS